MNSGASNTSRITWRWPDRLWNSVRNGVRRAGLQHTTLLSLTMSNCAHGPYASGKNRQSFEEAAEDLSNNISQEDFESLQEAICRDRRIDAEQDPDTLPDDFPECPADLPGLPVIRNLPVQVVCLQLLFLFALLL